MLALGSPFDPSAAEGRTSGSPTLPERDEGFSFGAEGVCSEAAIWGGGGVFGRRLVRERS